MATLPIAWPVARWHANRYRALRMSGDTTYRHQHRVAALLVQLFPAAPRSAVDYAASHDDHECVMGDIPASEKRHWSPELAALYTQREAAVRAEMGLPECPPDWQQQVKLVDRLDAYMWAMYWCPQAAADDEWISQRALLLSSAAILGVEDAVLELIDDAPRGVM